MNAVVIEKKKATEVLIDRAFTVYDEFLSIYGTTRLDITIAFKDLVEAIQKSIKETATVSPPWDIAECIGIIDDGFASIAEIVMNADIAGIKSGASHTYLVTTRADMDSFLQYHRMFAASGVNDRIYSDLVDQIHRSFPEDAEAKYLKHAHSTVLYARYLQNALESLPPDKHLPYMIALEKAKDWALLPEKSHESKSAKLVWPLQRFGLVVMKQHMSPSELITYYFGTSSGGSKLKSPTSSVDIFISMAKMKKINVLVMSAITASPVEYDVSSLMEASHGLDSSVGLSTPILKKFSTVKKYLEYDDGRVVPPGHLGYSLTRHVTSSAVRQHIIIRTIDGISWDAMHANKSKYVDVFLVEKILRGASPRVNAYQKIKAADFSRFIMPPPEMGEKIKKANKLLIQDLVNRITGRIIQYVDTSLLPLPENARGLEKAISDPRFNEILMEEFLASYVASGVDPKTPADELAGTFIADLENNIAIQFARNIKLNMIELGPDAKVFRDYRGDTLRTRLYNLFVDVIKRSVSSSIMTKENIYEKILIKDHLLGVLAAQLSKAE